MVDKVASMELTIKRAQARLRDLESQMESCEEADREEYHEMVQDQQNYIAGLYSGFQRILTHASF